MPQSPAEPDRRADHFRWPGAIRTPPTRRRSFCRTDEARAVADIDGVTPAIPLGDEILVDTIRKHLDLFGEETDQRRRRPLTGPQSAAGIVEIAEHEPIAEAIGIAPAAQNRREVRCRQRKVTDQLTLLDGGIEQLRDLCFAQSLPWRHSCLPTPASRGPSDPGQGVDERAAFDSERPADGGLGGPAVERRGHGGQLLGVDCRGTTVARDAARRPAQLESALAVCVSACGRSKAPPSTWQSL